MLRDITIGQFLPGSSALHRLDPRVKLLLTFAYIILLFCTSNFAGIAAAVVFLLICYRISRLAPALILKSLKPIVPVVVFTALLNIFFVEGTEIFRLGPIAPTWEGLWTGLLMATRVIALIAGSSLLTYTTSPMALTDAIERLLMPLSKLRFPVHELAMMMTIALRFIPTLIEETDKIISAQKARGADMESGSLIHRAKALIPILIPLFISAFRRADELALAMECRCYRGGDGRTRLKTLTLGRVDALAVLAFALLTAAVILCGIFLPLLTI